MGRDRAARLPAWRSVLVPFAVAALVAALALVVTRHSSAPAPVPTPTPPPSAPHPPPLGGAAVAWDPVHARLVVFGGFGLGDGVAGEFLDDTWVWDGRTWVEATGTAPEPRVGAVMAWDVAARRLLLTGGFGPGGRGPLNDTWSWDGSSWTQLDVRIQPESTLLPAMSAEARGDSVLLLTILASSGPTPLATTWRWDASSGWLAVTDDSPVFNSTALATPVETGGSVVLVASSPASVSGGETWTWDGQSWSAHLSGELPVFDPLSAVMAADVSSGEAVLFESSGGTPGRTFTWDGSRWTERARSGPATAAGMVTDTPGHPLLVGGPRRGDLTQLWEWRAGRWQLVGP